MSEPQDWTPTSKALPPQRTVVEAMDSGGHVQQLVLDGNLWWFPNHSMYVYFTPQFWRPIAGDLNPSTVAPTRPQE